MNVFRKLLFIILMSQVVFSATTLSSGVSKSGSVNEGAWKYYTISASAGSTVTVNMTGLSSDVDLYVKKGSQPTTNSYDERPYDGGTTSESATVTVSSSTTVYIGVQGFTSGSFTIKATVSGGSSSGGSSSGGSNGGSSNSGITTLSSGVAQSGSVNEGAWTYYTISASAGSTVTVNMTGLSSDVDLYVKKGSQPTTNSYDERPYDGGTTSESATVTVSSSTIVYIGVQGFTSGSFTIKATVSGGSSSGGSSSGGSSGGGSPSGTTTMSLESGVSKSGSVNQGNWEYYRIDSNGANSLNVAMTGLSVDVDLYVRKNSLPTDTESSYSCRPYEGGTTSEICNNISISSTDVIYIGVYGYESGSFTVKATINGNGNGNNNVLLGNNLSFPATGNNWTFIAGSSFHGAGGGIGGMDDTYALDLNLAGNGDNGLAVHPVSEGRIVYTNDNYGFILVEHIIPLQLDDGTILNTWYSAYMHMSNISQNNIDIVTTDTIGNISDTVGAGNVPDHLHFAIYSGNYTGVYSTLSSLSSIDIANNLKDFITPIDTWYEACTTNYANHTENSPWWELGETPCPY